MLAGGRPEPIKARIIVEKGFVSGKGFHAGVGVTGHRAEGVWWDYPLMGDAYRLPSFAGGATRRRVRIPITSSASPVGATAPAAKFISSSIRRWQRYYRSSHAVRSLVPDQMDSSVPHRRRHTAERVEAGRGGLWFSDQPIAGLPIDIVKNNKKGRLRSLEQELITASKGSCFEIQSARIRKKGLMLPFAPGLNETKTSMASMRRRRSTFLRYRLLQREHYWHASEASQCHVAEVIHVGPQTRLSTQGLIDKSI
jgi:hypothetical protein